MFSCRQGTHICLLLMLSMSPTGQYVQNAILVVLGLSKRCAKKMVEQLCFNGVDHLKGQSVYSRNSSWKGTQVLANLLRSLPEPGEVG